MNITSAFYVLMYQKHFSMSSEIVSYECECLNIITLLKHVVTCLIIPLWTFMLFKFVAIIKNTAMDYLCTLHDLVILFLRSKIESEGTDIFSVFLS